MKILLIIVMLCLSACTTVRVSKDNSGELMVSVTTLFKSVDGFEAERDGDGYVRVRMDKTHSGDPIKAANDILNVAARLQGGG